MLQRFLITPAYRIIKSIIMAICCLAVYAAAGTAIGIAIAKLMPTNQVVPIYFGIVGPLIIVLVIMLCQMSHNIIAPRVIECYNFCDECSHISIEIMNGNELIPEPATV